MSASANPGDIQSAPLHSTENETKSVKDECYKVYFISLFLGIASLFGKHLMNGSALYFKMLYPSYYSYHFMLYVILIYCGCDVLTLIFLIKYSNHTSFTCRIICGCILSFCLLLFLPICMNTIHDENIDLSLHLILILYGLCGISGSIVTVSIFGGFLNYLPKSYIRIAVSGQTIGGLIITGLRAIFKNNEPINHYNHQYKHDKMVYYQTKSKIYFGVGCGVNLLCIFIIFIIMCTKNKNKFIEFHLKRYYNYYYKKQIINNIFIVKVLRRIYKLCIALFLVTFTTFFIWPSMLVHITSKNNENINDHHWMPIILTFVFMSGDLIGRQVFTKLFFFKSVCNNKHLWKLCILRMVLYPICYSLWKGWIYNDGILYLIIACLSISNGYFRCLCFINLPKRLNDNQQQTGAALLAFSLILGITVGSFAQLLVVT